MDPVIITNVEFSHHDIPSKAFFRKTQKISIKLADEGIIITGNIIKWSEIGNVSVKFFNRNPYIYLETASGNNYSLFFENKFYYRKKAPWFGASKFITTEFVRILEEKGLFSVAKLEAIVSENTAVPTIHKIWNTLFYVIPIVLVLISIVVIYTGFMYGYQIPNS